jgi:hypothetical protein
VSQRAPMSRQEEPFGAEPPTRDDGFYEGPAATVQRRRAAAARVRRRRLLVADLALGAALALFGLIVAPGLAIVALGALVVLLGCGVWAVVERRRGRRVPPPRPVRPSPGSDASVPERRERAR